MPSKLQTYMQMADEAQRQITGSYRGWTGFLTTAARLYKYPYAEQVMIHAQRPDATACAEYDFWNEKMGRYVRRGSKGIALIDSSGEFARISLAHATCASPSSTAAAKGRGFGMCSTCRTRAAENFQRAAICGNTGRNTLTR